MKHLFSICLVSVYPLFSVVLNRPNDARETDLFSSFRKVPFTRVRVRAHLSARAWCAELFGNEAKQPDDHARLTPGAGGYTRAKQKAKQDRREDS